MVSGGHQHHAREVGAERERETAQRWALDDHAGDGRHVNRPERSAATVEVGRSQSPAVARSIAVQRHAGPHDSNLGAARPLATRAETLFVTLSADGRSRFAAGAFETAAAAGDSNGEARAVGPRADVRLA